MNSCVGRLSFLSMKSCKANNINILTTETTSFSLTSVRFRKRRDQPRRAPSKIYYVRQPTPKDPEEMAFLNTELKHYNTKMKSITAFLQSQRRPFSQMVKEQNSATNHNHDDLERAFELNRVWNENVAKQRTARLTAEALAVQAIKDSKLAENIKRLEKEQTRAKELLQSVAERRTQALDMDNLDEELEKFLDSEPINHNFAITATGEKIR